jgi:hypothetical protein
MNAPDNSDDIIDSRDVIARIEELEEERSALAEEASDALSMDGEGDTETERENNAAKVFTARSDLDQWDEGNGAELAALKSMAEEGEGYGDWAHGTTLVRDSYFKEYAQQYADDCGAVDASASWPMSCIDWDQAARELQMDFTAVDFDGITYWMHS